MSTVSIKNKVVNEAIFKEDVILLILDQRKTWKWMTFVDDEE